MAGIHRTEMFEGAETSADLRSRVAGFVVMVLVLALVAVAAFVALAG